MLTKVKNVVGNIKKIEALPLYCEVCEELTEITEKDIEQVQFNWVIECQKCN